MASWWDTMFSGGAEREAADGNRAALGRYTMDSLGALNTGLNRATTTTTAGANSANAYLGNNYDLYGNLRPAGNAILDQGRADSLAALGQAGAAYDPLTNLAGEYGRGRSLYQDSLGINGATGNQNAVNAFQAGPGYEFTRDQGLEALNRRRAAAGMLNSGNADIDAIRFGTGLANQTYGDWQNRLAGFVNPELSATSGAASGRAGVAGRMADVASADTLARLGLETGVTQGQAGTNTARAGNEVALGNSLANLYTGDATNRVGVFGNNVSGQMSANNLQAQGESQGARNLWNAGVQVATGLAGLGGGGGSFGSLFGGAGAGAAGSGMFNNMQNFGFNPVSFRGGYA